MKRKQMNTALIELIIVIMFFALSVTVIVQVMATSYSLANETKNQSELLIVSQNLIETVKSDPIRSDELLDQKVEMQAGQIKTYWFYYDNTVTKTDITNAKYKIKLDMQYDDSIYDTMVVIRLFVYDIETDQLIIDLETAQHLSSLGGEMYEKI